MFINFLLGRLANGYATAGHKAIRWDQMKCVTCSACSSARWQRATANASVLFCWTPKLTGSRLLMLRSSWACCRAMVLHKTQEATWRRKSTGHAFISESCILTPTLVVFIFMLMTSLSCTVDIRNVNPKTREISTVFDRADSMWVGRRLCANMQSTVSHSEQNWQLCVAMASWRAWPLAVHPPYGRSLSQADLDQLRQTVLPVQDVCVLQRIHQFVGCLTLCRPLLDQRLNAQRRQVLQQRGVSISMVLLRIRKHQI